MRDAFGRLIGSPELLDLSGRVECLRRLAGELQAGKSAESRWLGRSLATWLQRGGNLADRLGVKASRGSHRTPQAMVAQDARDDGLLRLSVAAGGDRKAAAILRGTRPCPRDCIELLEDLRRLNAPSSAAAIGRARRRVARPR